MDIAKEVVPTPGIRRAQTNQGNKAQRLLRVDEIYSRKDRRTHYVRTEKPKPRPDRSGKTALVVRRIIDTKGIPEDEQVDIKSQHVARLMQEFYKDAEGLSLTRDPPQAHPWHFFHAHGHLMSAKEEEKNKADPSQVLIDDVGTALRFIEEDFGGTFKDLSSLLPQGNITYELLWTLFPIGELVIAPRYSDFNNSQVIRPIYSGFAQRENKTKYFGIWGDLITHDGENFGRGEVRLEIDKFEGSKKITSLSALPFKLHPEYVLVRQQLIERGKRYVNLVRDQSVHSEYGGTLAVQAIPLLDGKNRRIKVAAGGRVVVDPEAFKLYGGMDALNEPRVYEEKVMTAFDGLNDDQYLICAWWVNGFCLTTKVWGCFDVTKLMDIKWNEDAFSKLAIAETRRRIILGLVKAHSKDEANFDDILRNKGKGMVGLLSGSPGVGKTSTAEAVAEVTHRALYQVSGGELGMEPDKVDKRLEMILEITRRWSAVLLIDEADVFLATRGNSIAQDTLVAIFLRRIEYFQGVLILTTNRGENIDPAFQSRIHFKLHYPDLDEEKRRQIWRTFVLDRPELLDIDEDDIRELAKRPLNGREIKNGTSCAISLAREEQKRMNLQDIVELLDVIFGPDSGTG